MIDRLAATPREHTLAATIEDYRALHRDYLLPDPEELFAVGYALPSGLGLALDQIAEGIASACPRAWDLCGDAGVGQAFDILAGRTVRAPDWMGANGLEWLYRLASEPRRLGKRYLVYNSLFLWYLARERLGRLAVSSKR